QFIPFKHFPVGLVDRLIPVVEAWRTVNSLAFKDKFECPVFSSTEVKYGVIKVKQQILIIFHGSNLFPDTENTYGLIISFCYGQRVWYNERVSVQTFAPKGRISMKKRSSGVLLHISSLPGKYGIGDFGQKAYKFVRLLAGSGTKYWQILPLGVTGFGDSPYQSFSAFAGNPYFIDLDELIERGWLSEEEAAGADLGDDAEKVDYSKLYLHKMPLFEAAYRRAEKE